MATPGWYSDPAGRPGGFRYWDGNAWGPDVTDDPFGTPGPGPASQPPPVAADRSDDPFDSPTDPEGIPVVPAYAGFQDFGQQYPLSAPVSQPSRRGHDDAPTGGRVAVFVLLAVVVTLALGVASFFVTRAVTDDDSDSAGSAGSADSGAPLEQPPPATDGADVFDDDTTPTIEQCTGGQPTVGAGAVGGRLTGGGLSLPPVDGFGPDLGQAAGFTFADGTTATSRIIEESLLNGWVAVYVLGGLDRDADFTSPEQAAGVVLECMATSPDFYSGFTGATVTDSRATTVSGSQAWQIDAEIRIDDPELTVEGDAATVIVVDTGDPDTFGLFVSLVPIGDADLIAQQQAQVAQLTVE